MAGPAALVVTEFDVSHPTWAELMMPYASHWYDNSCGISDTLAFGGDYQGQPRPFVGSVDTFVFDANEYPDDAAYANSVCRHADRRFTHAIVAAAMCNQAADHQVLCEILIHLATRVHGIIDFDRLDAPTGSGLVRCEWHFESELKWTTIGTPDQARIWLKHPQFHMLK